MTSGICGGVGKAISAKLILANITFTGIIDVAFYAAISATVGYGVKKAIDKAVFYSFFHFIVLCRTIPSLNINYYICDGIIQHYDQIKMLEKSINNII